MNLAQRRKRFAWASAAGLGFLALILIAINVVSYWLFFRLDLTRSHAYSLSPASKRLVRQLEDPVIVKVYFTPDLPPPYNAYGRYLRDMLSEYRSASKGRLRFEFVPPVPASVFEQQAMAANIVPLQFQEVGASQLQVRQAFMGLVLFYRNKSETIPVVKDVQTLEYELTSRIGKMAQRQKKVVAVVSGHGETQWQGGQSKLSQDLQDLYTFNSVSLPAASTAPLQADALLVVGPKQKFDDKSLWAIDQAIMRGIPAAFLIDVKNFVPGQFMVFDVQTGLPDLLKHYGVTLGNRLVYDAQCQTIGVTQNLGGFAFQTSIPYPYIPLVNHFDATHQPLMRGLDSFALPFPVALQPSLQTGGARFVPLFSSSPRSWLANEQTYSVAPNKVPQPTKEDPQGPFILGAMLEGSLPSYFQSKPSPVPGQALIGTSPKTQIVVIGTSEMVNPALPELPGSEALFSNILAFLTHDETLLGIRSKGEIIKPLKPLGPWARQIVKLVSVLGAALLAVIWGLWRWRKRQAWRQTIAKAF